MSLLEVLQNYIVQVVLHLLLLILLESMQDVAREMFTMPNCFVKLFAGITDSRSILQNPPLVFPCLYLQLSHSEIMLRLPLVQFVYLLQCLFF